MCRLLAYMGERTLLADVVLWPERSIVKQSYAAAERLNDPSLPAHAAMGNLNADGFGLGWYASADLGGTDMEGDDTPCLYKSVQPAFNNENVSRLASKISSPFIFAHVRAAMPGMPVSEQNCHPFTHGRYMFMHNGVVGGFCQIRRRLADLLSDEMFTMVSSFHSDSAVAFALFLNQLPSLEDELSSEVLLDAMQKTITIINKTQRECGIPESTVSLLNFVVGDGKTLVATRFVSPSTNQAASLYYAEGSEFKRVAHSNEPLGGDGDLIRRASARLNPAASSKVCESPYEVTFSERCPRVVLVASEPVTSSRTDWVKLPKNTALVVTTDADGHYNLTRSPLTADGVHSRQKEVVRTLEALKISQQVRNQNWSASAASLTSFRRLPSFPMGGGKGLIPFNGGFQCLCGREHPAEVLRASLRASNTNGAFTPGGCTPVPRYRMTSPSPSTGGGGALPRAQFGSDAGAPIALCSPVPSGGLAASLKASADGESDAAHSSRGAVVEDPLLGPRVEDHTLTGHDGCVLAMQVCKNRLVSCGADGQVRLWNLEDFGRAGELRGNSGPVLKMETHGGALYTCAGQHVRVWDLEAARCAHAFRTCACDGTVRSLVVADGAHGGPRVLVGGQDGSIKAFNLPPDVLAAGSDAAAADDAAEPDATSKPESSHLGSINTMQVCGRYLASGGADATIRVWCIETLAHLKTLYSHRGSVITLLATGDLLLSGGRDNHIRAWDLETLMCRHTLQGHTDDVLHINTVTGKRPSTTPSRSGALDEAQPVLVASASADCTIRLWSGVDWTCMRVIQVVNPSPMPVMCCASNGQLLATGQPDGSIKLWDVEDVYVRAMFVAADQGNDFDSPVACSPVGSPVPNGSMSDSAARGHSNLGAGAVVLAEPSTSSNRDKRPPMIPMTPRARSRSPSRSLRRSEVELERALREFVALETVSLDPSRRDACFHGAKYVAHLLESLGAEVLVQRPADDKNPIVFGRLSVNSAWPTVTFYGHYDVQPAMERDWRTDPFSVHAEDGYLYGRGVSDNKGPILAFIFAIKEMLGKRHSRGKGLPVNCSFIFEGEEEAGSHGLEACLRANGKFFAGTDLIVISNTNWVGEHTPCLTYGMRGMITLSVQVSGPARDTHSGNEGGTFNEPMSDLMKILATLVDAHASINVPGFYDDVVDCSNDPKIDEVAGSNEFDVHKYMAHIGVRKLTTRNSVSELLLQRWCAPTLSVVDVLMGDQLQTAEGRGSSAYRFGPTRFSVIPRCAVGKVSLRFVPRQTSEQLVRCLSDHLKYEFAKLRTANTLSIEVHSVGDFWEGDPNSKFFQLADSAVRKEWGCAPLYVREGGTMPVAGMLEQVVGAPAIMLPMGQSTDNCHLANERMRRSNLVKGKNVVKHLLHEVAAAYGQTGEPGGIPLSANPSCELDEASVSFVSTSSC